MMRRVLMLMLLASPVYAGDAPSLFLTPEEMALQQGESAARNATSLQAIVYYAPDHWKIWINGRAITPATRDAEIEIVEVTPQHARLVQKIGEKERLLILAPHQTYMWNEDRVIETR